MPILTTIVTEVLDTRFFVGFELGFVGLELTGLGFVGLKCVRSGGRVGGDFVKGERLMG